MPKIKTNRGARKRFKKTAGGLKRRRANRAHILTKKTTKRKRHLRVSTKSMVHANDVRLVKRALGE